jgi:NAD(P)-dependent dehydrogenase (short-subunit alcohol dehydrogenase family)
MLRGMQHTTGMRLAGKVAIITGAAGGIGGAAARCFVAEGARVVLSDRDEQGLAAVAEPLGAAAVAIAGDVADPTTAARAVAAAQDRFGALHVGVLGYAGLGPYVASKHAVIGLMRTAAIELASANIRVNTVNPGPIDNRMMRSIAEQSAPAGGEAVRAALEHDVPLARYGTNEEVARLALFLASDESSYCTGSVFMVDGGFAAR